MQRITALIVAAALVVAVCPADASQPLSGEAEAAALQQMAAAIPLGTRVRLRTRGGRGMSGTLIAVEPDRVIVKRASRVAEPAVGVAFADLAELHRDQKGGFSVGKAIGIGLAAGAGAVLTLFSIAVAIHD